MSVKPTFQLARIRLLDLPTLVVLITALLCTSLVQVAAGALNDTDITFWVDDTANIAICTAVVADGCTFPRQGTRYGRDAQAATGKAWQSLARAVHCSAVQCSIVGQKKSASFPLDT